MLVERIWCGIVGCAFILVGTMRFFPIEGSEDWGVPEPIHGTLHLISGLIFLGGSVLLNGRLSGPVVRWLGCFWLILGILGQLKLLEAVEALSFSDNKTHTIVGAVTLLVGFHRNLLPMHQIFSWRKKSGGPWSRNLEPPALSTPPLLSL